MRIADDADDGPGHGRDSMTWLVNDKLFQVVCPVDAQAQA
jgi:hypothetical protein